MEEQFMKEFGWTYDEAEGQGPERMWPGRICDEGLCSEKDCTCEGRNSKGFAKKGVGKQTMGKQLRRGGQKMRHTVKMVTTLRGRKLPSRLLRLMLQMMSRNLQQLPRNKQTLAIT
jgi:hypothetical protein